MSEGEHIEVEPDTYGTATAPDWLSTTGTDSCIAVGIADDASRRAWLCHDSSIAEDGSTLQKMLDEAVSPGGNSLQIWILGGKMRAGSEESVRLASLAAIALVRAAAPHANITNRLGVGQGDIVLIFEAGCWKLYEEPDEGLTPGDLL